jgi:hypothetical protein
VGWDLVHTAQPRRAISSASDTGNAVIPSVPTLVTVRVMEARGFADGYMRSARCLVTFGPHRRMSSWRSVSGGIAVFNFRPHKPICAPHSVPAFDAASFDYLQWQAWDVVVSVFTFSPLEGVRLAGYVRIPASTVTRTVGTPGATVPVEAKWYDVRPAFKPSHSTLPEGTDSITMLDSSGAAGFFSGEVVAPGAACVRLFAQVAITQKISSTNSDGGADDGFSPATDDISAYSRHRSQRASALQGDGEDSEDQAAPDVRRIITEVGIRPPPIPLPLRGLLASSPLYAAGLEAAAMLHGTSSIKSGPRFLAAAAAGLEGSSVVQQQDLFIAIYQARGLPVPPHSLLCHAYARRDRLKAAQDENAAAMADFLDKPSDKPVAANVDRPSFGIGPAGVAPMASSIFEEQRGLVVQVSSSVTASHMSPPCCEVGPAPLWYHSIVLPYTPLVSAAVQPAGTVLPPPPGLRFTVLLDGRPVAQTEEGALSVSASPQWVSLTTPADANVDAGSLLVLCSFDEALLSQWRAFVSPDVDAAVLRAADDLQLQARSDSSMPDRVDKSWECAKTRGVSKDVALPLAWLVQPWLPSLRPCSVKVFAQGLRDLSLPDEDAGDVGDFPPGLAAAEWRIEMRLPDVADALLASGAWYRHKQVGCQAGTPFQQPVPSVDMIDNACMPGAEAGAPVSSHARYTPWALPPPPLPDLLVEVAGMAPRHVDYQRTRSVSIARSSINVVLTGQGRMVNPPQQGGVLPRDLLRRLCLTNPQLLVSGGSDSLAWLPSSPLFAPDALVYVWRRPVGATTTVVDDDAALSWTTLVQVSEPVQLCKPSPPYAHPSHISQNFLSCSMGGEGLMDGYS